MLETYYMCGYWMQKDEIIQMHVFLFQVRSFLEDNTTNIPSDAFIPYKNLEVCPQHVFKSKDDQKSAIFELCRGISYILKYHSSTEQQRNPTTVYQPYNVL